MLNVAVAESKIQNDVGWGMVQNLPIIGEGSLFDGSDENRDESERPNNEKEGKRIKQRLANYLQVVYLHTKQNIRLSLQDIFIRRPS
jgi:hypothetical protein